MKKGPAIRGSKECLQTCTGAIGAIRAMLAQNQELAQKVGGATITATVSEHDPEFPQSCVVDATAKRGRISILEGLQVACVHGKTVDTIPTDAQIRVKRDAWSAAHNGLTHPDDKIQAG
jgi:hypothetical protein